MDKDLTPFEQKALDVLENRRFWTALLIVIVTAIAVASIRFFKNESATKVERQAAEKLFLVEKEESEGVADNSRIFSAEFAKKRAEWTPEKKALLRKQLDELVAEFPKTNAAQSARIRLGSLNYLDGKFDAALASYDEVIKAGSPVATDIPYLTAQLGKGYIYENTQKSADALKIYETLAKDDKSPLIAEALLGRVRVLRQLGREKESEPLVTRLKTDFVGSPYDEAARAYESGVVK